MKVKFYFDTGNKTIRLTPEIRLFHGENILGQETIKNLGIDKMPGFSLDGKVFGKTEVVATNVVIEDKPIKVEGKLDFDKIWTPSRIINYPIDRFKRVIAGQDNIAKLTELWQFVRSKREMREALKARISEVDPNSQYV